MDLTASHASTVSDDVLKTCIKLHGTQDFRKTMDEVIRDTRILCDAEVCTIMLMECSTGTVSILAKSVRADCKLKTVTQFVNFYDIATSWANTIGDSDCLIIRNERDMQYIREINYPWWLTLDEAGVDSVVMFPLRFDHEVLGFIWATNFDTRNTLRIKETLELTTFFLSSQIASYKMMKRLEHIGYTDMMTGVKNRNAMNDRVSSIVNGSEVLTEPFGIVFADLNGLKTINDMEGHNAGDLLLKKAAILLQEIFDGNDIYRAGGDEFVVIITGCTPEELTKKTEKLKARSDTPENVCFAVGSYCAEPGCDIRDAMRLADEDMYKDKAQFYREHPESDRRLQDRK
jgi:diguanylate cyclase (GGDEF)-like protein